MMITNHPKGIAIMKFSLIMLLSSIICHATETTKDTPISTTPLEAQLSDLNQNKVFLEQQIKHLQETVRNDREEVISTQLTLHEEGSKFETTANLYSLSSQASALTDKIEANQKKLKEFQDRLEKNQQKIDNLTAKKEPTNKKDGKPISQSPGTEKNDRPSPQPSKAEENEKPRKCGCKK